MNLNEMQSELMRQAAAGSKDALAVLLDSLEASGVSVAERQTVQLEAMVRSICANMPGGPTALATLNHLFVKMQRQMNDLREDSGGGWGQVWRAARDAIPDSWAHSLVLLMAQSMEQVKREPTLIPETLRIELNGPMRRRGSTKMGLVIAGEVTHDHSTSEHLWSHAYVGSGARTVARSDEAFAVVTWMTHPMIPENISVRAAEIPVVSGSGGAL